MSGSIASHFLGFHEHFRQDLREVIDVAGDRTRKTPPPPPPPPPSCAI